MQPTSFRIHPIGKKTDSNYAHLNLSINAASEVYSGALEKLQRPVAQVGDAKNGKKKTRESHF